MTAPTNKTDIANLALDRIGGLLIGSLDPPTTEQEIFIARHYELDKQILLRSYQWSFAKKRITISRSGTPAFEYSDEYSMPHDYIRFLSIENYTEMPGSSTYAIEGNKILLNNSGAPSLNIIYISNTDAVTFFDPLFVNLLVLKLAYKLAPRQTVDEKLVQGIRAELKDEEPKAISITSQERPPRKKQISRYLRAHRRIRPVYERG
jgi:hypothetical protein